MKATQCRRGFLRALVAYFQCNHRSPGGLPQEPSHEHVQIHHALCELYYSACHRLCVFLTVIDVNHS